MIFFCSGERNVLLRFTGGTCIRSDFESSVGSRLRGQAKSFIFWARGRARWTTSPSGREKFNPSRSSPGSEGGFWRFGSGVVSGSDSASFEGIFGPCRRMALPVGRRFCGGASSSPGFKINVNSGDFADVDAVGGAFGAFVRLGVVLLCSEACA